MIDSRGATLLQVSSVQGVGYLAPANGYACPNFRLALAQLQAVVSISYLQEFLDNPIKR